MGLPELSFSYEAAAQQVVARSKRGIVALLLQDAGLTTGVYTVAHEADIPSELGATNADYVKRALVGYTSRPSKIYLSVVAADGTVTTALDQLTPLDYDYVAGFPDADSADAKALGDAVIAKRKSNYIGKAVVSGYAANNEGVINFTTGSIQTAAGIFSGITLAKGTFSAPAYCGRIAGLLAGSPQEGSATGAALPEVTVVAAQTDEDAAEAIEDGELILWHDGRKVRVPRAVNSKTTISDSEAAILKKIKAIETIDLIHYYAITTADDEYRGQCANTYDNKCVLISALKDYLKALEPDLLAEGTSNAEIDLEATRAYLKEQDVAVEDMSDDEILRANTGSYVFIALSGYIMDAMEDFRIVLRLSNT